MPSWELAVTMLTLCGRVGVRRGAAALPRPGSEEKATIWHRRANRSRRTLTLSLQHHILSLLRRSRDLADLIESRYSTAQQTDTHASRHAEPFRPPHVCNTGRNCLMMTATPLPTSLEQSCCSISNAYRQPSSVLTVHIHVDRPLKLFTLSPLRHSFLLVQSPNAPLVALQTAHTHTHVTLPLPSLHTHSFQTHASHLGAPSPCQCHNR